MIDDGRRSSAVSIILPSGRLRAFQSITIRCLAELSYPERELIVVDDGALSGDELKTIEKSGGAIISVKPDTPQGTMLNVGAEAASGHYCLVIRSGDWFATDVVIGLLDAIETTQTDVCRPFFSFAMPYLQFDLQSWNVVTIRDCTSPGPVLFFDRDDWFDRPFRSVRRNVNDWFVYDQTMRGRRALPIALGQRYVSLRNDLDSRHRAPHQTRAQVFDLNREETSETLAPETVLPGWAIDTFREVRTAHEVNGG